MVAGGGKDGERGRKGWGKDLGGKLLRDMAGTGTGQLVGINEEPSVGVAGVHGQHPVVDILLGALGLVAGGQQPAGRLGEQAGLQPRGLCVVVVAVAVALRDVLQDDAPVALHIDGTGDLLIAHCGGTEVTLWPYPVRCVIGARALGGSGVVAVVKVLLLRPRDILHQVIRGLVGDVRVLLQEEWILGDLGRDVIGWILGVRHTEREIRTLGTLGRGLGVTVTIARGMVLRAMVSHCRAMVRHHRSGMVSHHWDMVRHDGGMVSDGVGYCMVGEGSGVVGNGDNSGICPDDRQGDYEENCNQSRDHGAGCEL